MPIKCRKCGGDHFTSKCGKEKKMCIEIKDNVKPIKSFEKKKQHKPFEKKKQHKPFNKRDNNSFFNRRDPREKTVKIKLFNLPQDLTLQNLNKILIGWGKIGNVKIKNCRIERENCKYSIIDFYDKDAAEYFVKAIDRTLMGPLMLSATLI
tara:strand:+ start:6883 stop:7335 length:453 start_codon:yes stop_codon:yes gene_type:complete